MSATDGNAGMVGEYIGAVFKYRLMTSTYEGCKRFDAEMREGEITPEEFERRMRLIADVYQDEESTHSMQDKLMLEVLRQNGFEAGAKVYGESTKWYA